MQLAIHILLKSPIVKFFLYLILGALVLKTYGLFIKAGTIVLTNNPSASDFLAFYNGASLFLRENHQNVYILSHQLANQHLLSPVTNSLNIFLPFLNPPFLLWLFVPFAYLSLNTAYALWTACNFLMIFIICYMAVQQIKLAPWYSKLIMVLAICTFIPMLTSLFIGQLSFILILLFLTAWIFAKNGWNFRSGLILSLLLLKPHFFLLPFFAVLLQRRKHFTMGILTGTAVLVGISFLTVGVQGVVHYGELIQTAMGWSKGYGIEIASQHSLQTALLFLTNTSSLDIIRIPWYITIILVSIPTLLVWSRKYDQTSTAFSLQWCILILATLLTSPHTHFHDLVLLLVIGIIIATLTTQKKIQLTYQLLVLLIAGYMIALIGYLLQVYGHLETRPGWIIISVTYMLLFWGVLIWKLFFLTRVDEEKRNQSTYKGKKSANPHHHTKRLNK